MQIQHLFDQRLGRDTTVTFDDVGDPTRLDPTLFVGQVVLASRQPPQQHGD
ncbi:MAG: hypothetical protein PVG27_12775 [Chloroflexota bacterium]